MRQVFGIPVGGLSVALAALLVAAVGVLTVLVIRNIVFFKLGVRNLARRPARSALIVVGLMLGTAIIGSALFTGDTMSRTVRRSVFVALGHTDETVTVGSATPDPALGAELEATRTYFEAARLDDVDRAAARSSRVDGVAPAIIEPVAVQHPTAGRSEPRVTLFASDPGRLASFGAMTLTTGGQTSLGGLGSGEILLNEEAARELAAGPGDELSLLLPGGEQSVVVSGVVSFEGTGDDGPSVLVPLAAAQRMLDRDGLLNTILVSNTGGASSGVAHTDEVDRVLDEALTPLGLQSNPVKKDGLDYADERGDAYLELFTTFGMFSILAGVVLIFLIFVMLATERRSEMGMARAVGTQRGHLVEIFLFEGAAYDLAAAAVGAALGVGVSFAMVTVTAAALTTGDLELVFGLEPRSVLVAYAMGVLLTLAVVTASAWRVSRLNIVSAIRDLPEPASPRRHRRWVAISIVAAIGTGLTLAGVDGKRVTPFMIGVSLLVVAGAEVARALGVPERVARTGAGLALVAWSFVPFRISFAPLGDHPAMDFSMWVVDGVIVVLGATWTIVNNADVLLSAVSRAASRIRSLAPVMKMAITYPLRSRFRTGTTLAMFTLVVFTLVSGTTVYTAFIDAADDVDRFGGGFDVRGVTAPGAVDDMSAAVAARPELRDDITAVASESYVPVEARQANGDDAFESYPLRGLDAAFLEETTFELATMAAGFRSASEVWAALAQRPGLAVVDASVVPRRADWTGSMPPPFRLSGLYLEEEGFDPVPVIVRDPQTGTETELTVIGVLTDDVPRAMAGISVSQAFAASFGDRARPTMHYFRLAPGADDDAVADRLEASFLAAGLEAETFQDILDEAIGGAMTLNRLMQGFIGLGLLVGIAALGVVSARAVVERRQQLGVLRAIGFQPAMIRRTLLLEASFVSLTAIVVGTALALGLSYNVITYSADQALWQNVRFAVPWADLAIVTAGVYLAALATTLLPAIRASRVYPAEALRYQ